MAGSHSGPFSKLGGDIQIQLALAMNANSKEQECIDLFKNLEETHPVSAIARQAANLRFIMEAPKLEVGEDEKVSVPVLDLDANKCATTSFCLLHLCMSYRSHMWLKCSCRNRATYTTKHGGTELVLVSSVCSFYRFLSTRLHAGLVVAG